MNSESDPMLASGLKILQSGAEIVVNICPKDILIITLGSIFAGSTLGANCSPPAPVPDVEELKLDDSWGLWCKLSQEHPEFVDLSPFCARIAESTNECFLVMLNGWEFFERFACLVHSLPSTVTSLMPLATAQYLKRDEGDRPSTIPDNVQNMALIVQFVGLPDDTVFSMEYNVRGAQTAAYHLMGLV
ncbi:unnamed protein product [Penicillium pancosmium]